MTTASVSVSSGVTDNTTLRAAGSAIHGMFSTVGLVQTSDTGQVNWSTVTWTTGTNTVGVEVWKCNDSLQPTKPAFMKVTYTQTSNVLRISTVRIGTGTDGASGLTGIVGGSMTVSPSAPTAATTTWVACSDASSIAFCSSQSILNANNTGFFWFDRSRDTSGAITGEAIHYGAGFSPSSNITGTIELTTAVDHNTSSSGCAIMIPFNILSNTLSTGTDVYVTPATYVANGKLLPPPLALVGYVLTDIAANSVISVVSIDGSAHSFLCLGNVTLANNGGNGIASVVPAMRWE